MTEDKLPPQNLEAERSVLGSMLLDREAIGPARGIIREVDFYQNAHRLIFHAVLELHDKGDPVDYITLTDKLAASGKLEEAGGGAYQTALTDQTPTSAHVEHYARIVKACAERRAIIRQASSMTAAAYNQSENEPAQIVEDARQALAELTRQSLAAIIAAPRTLAEGLEDFKRAIENPPLGYQSGFTKLDNLLHGLKPGVFVIAAPPSAGKTTFVNQLMGQACANGAPGLFFSYEQNASELLAKSVSRHFRISNEAFYADDETRKTSVLTKLQDTEIQAWKDGPGRLKVIEADARHTLKIIRHLAEQEKEKANGTAPIIALDYLQIIPDPSKYSSTRDKVDYLVSELRRIARDLDAPIIAISSMARSEYERVTMAGFKESGGIEYGADVAAILEVESESGQTRNMTLAVLKHRGGRREKIFFTYDLIRDTFTEQDRVPQAIDYRASLGEATDKRDEKSHESRSRKSRQEKIKY